ncbi:MAG TPA: CHAP domain-containing protein [Mycobacteriales bacterium]|nr:CHAP domain-containing protein [Mycobacteriales bacterium]
MRHSLRHLPFTASAVLGLAAPALAALLLTSATPGLAAVPAPAAAVADPAEPVVHAPVALTVTKPAPRVVVRKVLPRTRVVTARPVPRKAAVRPRSHVATRPVARPKPKPRPTQTSQPSGSNDYPYRTQSDYYAVDRWGFTQRQCVSFAAWRLSQHGHTINNRDNWGSASTWDDTARRMGFAVTRTAHVGAVAQWNAHESSPYYSKGASSPNGSFAAGGYGHVGWVKKVYSDGSVLVEQYNMSNSRSYSVMRVKAPRYLVIR